MEQTIVDFKENLEALTNAVRNHISKERLEKCESVLMEVADILDENDINMVECALIASYLLLFFINMMEKHEKE